MFWIVCHPSSRSTELCLTEITLSGGSQIFFVCLVNVWQHNFEPVVCVCAQYEGLGTGCQHLVPCTHNIGSKLRCQTPTKHTKNICEPPLRVISVKHSSVLPDDGWHTIRKMLE